MDCKFCKGSYQQRIRLMENKEKSHNVFINECNYLEDNITGGKKECLLRHWYIRFVDAETGKQSEKKVSAYKILK